LLCLNALKSVFGKPCVRYFKERFNSCPERRIDAINAMSVS
jgi:hypothetical protein